MDGDLVMLVINVLESYPALVSGGHVLHRETFRPTTTPEIK